MRRFLSALSICVYAYFLGKTPAPGYVAIGTIA